MSCPTKIIEKFISADFLSHEVQLKLTQILFISITSVALFVLIFQQAIEGILFAGEKTTMDEFALFFLAAIAVFVQFWTNKLKKVFILLILIFLYLILISVLFGENHSFNQIVLQSFLHLQYFIILLSLYVIHQRYHGFINRLLNATVIIAATGGLMQILLPSVFSGIFWSQDISPDPFNMLRMEGLQRNANALGVFFAFYTVLLIFQKEYLKNKSLRIIAISGCVLIIILTGSRSALLFVLIGVLFTNLALYKKVSIGLMILFLLILTGTLENLQTKTARNIENVTELSANESRYIRWLMSYYGTELALNNFPIGTGAATFGTALSHESPIYHEVGIADLPTVSGGGGIHDSNYGSISGEFGFIGLFIFYGLGSYILIYIFQKWKPLFVRPYGHWQFIIALVIICIVSTFFRPLFLSSYYGTIVTMTLFSYLEAEYERVNRLHKDFLSIEK